LEQEFFLHHQIVAVVKRVEFVGESVTYTVLRGHWCHIIALNGHGPSKEKSDDLKDSFNQELEQVFFSSHFPKYHPKFLLGDFNANVK
jgi:hypothetical protein